MYFLAYKGIAMIAKFKAGYVPYLFCMQCSLPQTHMSHHKKTFHCLNKSDSKIEETFDYRSEAKYLPVNGLYNYSVLNQ